MSDLDRSTPELPIRNIDRPGLPLQDQEFTTVPVPPDEPELADPKTFLERVRTFDFEKSDIATAAAVVGGALALLGTYRAFRNHTSSINTSEGSFDINVEPAHHLKGFVSALSKEGEAVSFEIDKGVLGWLRSKASENRKGRNSQEKPPKVDADASPSVGAWLIDPKGRTIYPLREDAIPKSTKHDSYRKKIILLGKAVKAIASTASPEKPETEADK